MPKLEFTFHKRWINKNKYYFFHPVLTEKEMKEKGFIFFWWIGTYLWACQKVR